MGLVAAADMEKSLGGVLGPLLSKVVSYSATNKDVAAIITKYGLKQTTNQPAGGKNTSMPAVTIPASGN